MQEAARQESRSPNKASFAINLLANFNHLDYFERREDFFVSL